MARRITSDRTAKAYSLALFIAGLAILTYLRSWWPGIMLVVGIPLSLRQYLSGRHYDMYVTLFVSIGVFITVAFSISWEVLLPILFSIGAIYIFFREFLEGKPHTEVEEEEELNAEIEEDNKKP
jgi:predicted membrane protein